ncbi:MAG: hypothetical protein AAF762_07130 [Pseudomonadota bacterium]
MKRFMATITATALSLGSMAAADTAKVDSVFVTVSPAADEANVEEVWPTLGSDLKTVLDDKLALYRDNDGYDVSIRIIDVSLDGSKILTEDDEFNRVEGWVYVRPGDDASDVTPIKVIVDAQTGAVFKNPDGSVQIPGAELFYNAMLNGFAEQTREAILKLE